MTARWEVGGGLEQPPEGAPNCTGVLLLDGAKTSLLRGAVDAVSTERKYFLASRSSSQLQPANERHRGPPSQWKPPGLRRNCHWKHLWTPGQEASFGCCPSRSPGQASSAITHLCVKKGFEGLTARKASVGDVHCSCSSHWPHVVTEPWKWGWSKRKCAVYVNCTLDSKDFVKLTAHGHL
ncbi:uncharacterized protein LOC130542132 isoform X2 [Ursus arctos]|uniref:uncharacterized protein LOC130542132 isoform X2 n=1 Tax=Ursus arctos TaxID=9644 RepID=UPI0025499A47|nr:uncharacterized protein LOC130542132 isoform X2 [Ursus arctos]